MFGRNSEQSISFSNARFRELRRKNKEATAAAINEYRLATQNQSKPATRQKRQNNLRNTLAAGANANRGGRKRNRNVAASDSQFSSGVELSISESEDCSISDIEDEGYTSGSGDNSIGERCEKRRKTRWENAASDSGGAARVNGAQPPLPSYQDCGVSDIAESREFHFIKTNINKIDFTNGYIASAWIEYMARGNVAIRAKFRNGRQFFDCMWGKRREYNTRIIIGDESGVTNGWSTASRIALLQSRFLKKARENYDAVAAKSPAPEKFDFCQTTDYPEPRLTNENAQILLRAGILFSISSTAAAPIPKSVFCNYNRYEIEWTLRLLGVAWGYESTWSAVAEAKPIGAAESFRDAGKLSVPERLKIIDAMLFDLNTRVFEIAESVHDLKLYTDVTATTAFYHAIMQFYKKNIYCRIQKTPNRDERLFILLDKIAPRLASNYKETYLNGIAAAANSSSPPSLEENNNRQRRLYESTHYARGKEALEKYVIGEFKQVFNMGVIQKDVCTFLRNILLPMDIVIQYRSKKGIDTKSSFMASKEILGRGELHYLDITLSEKSDDDFISGEKVDINSAWLVRSVVHCKMADNCVSQYNSIYNWTAENVLFDRDIPFVIDVLAPRKKKSAAFGFDGFFTRSPYIVLITTQFYFVYGDHVVEVDDIIEGMMLWLIVTFNVYESIVRTNDNQVVNIEKEARQMLDVCFAHIDEFYQMKRIIGHPRDAAAKKQPPPQDGSDGENFMCGGTVVQIGGDGSDAEAAIAMQVETVNVEATAAESSLCGMFGGMTLSTTAAADAVADVDSEANVDSGDDSSDYYEEESSGSGGSGGAESQDEDDVMAGDD